MGKGGEVRLGRGASGRPSPKSVDWVQVVALLLTAQEGCPPYTSPGSLPLAQQFNSLPVTSVRSQRRHFNS